MRTVILTYTNGRIEEHQAAHHPSQHQGVLEIVLAGNKAILHVPIAQLVCWEVRG